MERTRTRWAVGRAGRRVARTRRAIAGRRRRVRCGKNTSPSDSHNTACCCNPLYVKPWWKTLVQIIMLHRLQGNCSRRTLPACARTRRMQEATYTRLHPGMPECADMFGVPCLDSWDCRPGSSGCTRDWSGCRPG